MECSRSPSGYSRENPVRHIFGMERTTSSITVPACCYQRLSKSTQNGSSQRFGKTNACQGSDTSCAGCQSLSRLLQPPVSGTKTWEQVETCDRLITTKQICKNPTFPDGDGFDNSKFSKTGRMGYVHRSYRCLLSSKDQEKISKVFSLSHSGRNISISRNALWTGNSSFGVHPSWETVQSNSFFSEPKNQSIFRRLAASSSNSSGVRSQHDKSSSVSDLSGLCSQLSEIAIGTNTEVRVSGREVRFDNVNCIPDPETIGENKRKNLQFHKLSDKDCSAVDVTDRVTSVHNFSSGHEPIKDSPFAVAVEDKVVLVPIIGEESVSRRGNSRQSSMVGSEGGSHERSPFASSKTTDLNLHGRIHSRLGSPLRRIRDKRAVDKTRTRVAYKSPRTKSNLVGSETFHIISQGQSSDGAVRQFDSSGILKKSGRNQSGSKHGPVLVNLDVHREAQDSVTSSTHSRSPQCSGGPVVQEGTNSPNRMESFSSSVPPVVQNKVETNDRSICNISESQTGVVCKPLPRSERNRSRCHESRLDREGVICVPSNQDDNCGSKKSKRRTLQTVVNSSSLAKSSLVSRSNGSHSGGPSSATSNKDSVETTGKSSLLRSKSTDAQSACLVNRHSELISEGFSESLATRISAPQRESTCTMYKSRVDLFVKWTKDNELDAGNPTIPMIAQFFEHLFIVKELSPRTIRGYKTALANYFSPKVIEIRTDPSLLRLLAGFFRDKPVSAIKVLPWDLRLVLDALKKPPFEPLNGVDMKFLTFKVVFLFAMASGRRRSEIHALDFSTVKWLKVGGFYTFSVKPMLGFIAKNQKATSSALVDITIPSLQEFLGPDLKDTSDKFLCPVRSLKFYLNRTRTMRTGKKRLFISFLPGKEGDICQVTLSSWLRNTIQLAYRLQTDSPLPEGTRPHQVRSAAASWAWKGGVSLSQVMDACYWKSQDTFTSFYLKDCWSQEGEKYSLGPIVSAGSVV